MTPDTVSDHLRKVTVSDWRALIGNCGQLVGNRAATLQKPKTRYFAIRKRHGGEAHRFLKF